MCRCADGVRCTAFTWTGARAPILDATATEVVSCELRGRRCGEGLAQAGSGEMRLCRMNAPPTSKVLRLRRTGGGRDGVRGWGEERLDPRTERCGMRTECLRWETRMRWWRTHSISHPHPPSTHPRHTVRRTRRLRAVALPPSTHPHRTVRRPRAVRFLRSAQSRCRLWEKLSRAEPGSRGMACGLRLALWESGRRRRWCIRAFVECREGCERLWKQGEGAHGGRGSRCIRIPWVGAVVHPRCVPSSRACS
ncbi:hypothetical protein B0H13DRAFT_1179888 [Mycena leptocephala]|nr:hypothetical protein B0H13DRAFT_1179888 [Mycena leptocephala]